MAVAASALSVGPVRYLVRPEPALALITCSSCPAGSSCCDGWTTFCCTLTGDNACPPYSYAGGWWKCTSYSGSRYCEDEGVRYYIDCNRLPGRACPDGCGCPNGDCHNRRTCCVNFRYGNCRTDVAEVTPVVCRVMLCANPCRHEEYRNCSCSGPADDRTCVHEAACLPADRPRRRRRRRERPPVDVPDTGRLPPVVMPPEINRSL